MMSEQTGSWSEAERIMQGELVPLRVAVTPQQFDILLRHSQVTGRKLEETLRDAIDVFAIQLDAALRHRLCKDCGRIERAPTGIREKRCRRCHEPMLNLLLTSRGTFEWDGEQYNEVK